LQARCDSQVQLKQKSTWDELSWRAWVGSDAVDALDGFVNRAGFSGGSNTSAGRSLMSKTTTKFIPGRKSRARPIRHDKRRYKRRNRIEIMFGRLKDWRRVATRYDRCPKGFLSPIALAATVIFWL
jgi:hypothetical protein